MTLTNAQRHTDNSGGAIVSGHSLVLDNVIIQNNIAPRGGGVSFLTQYAGQSLTITNSQFLNNIAAPLVATVSNSLGGGLKIGENCPNTRTVPVTVNIANSLFSGNHVSPYCSAASAEESISAPLPPTSRLPIPASSTIMSTRPIHRSQRRLTRAAASAEPASR